MFHLDFQEMIKFQMCLCLRMLKIFDVLWVMCILRSEFTCRPLQSLRKMSCIILLYCHNLLRLLTNLYFNLLFYKLQPFKFMVLKHILINVFITICKH